MRDFGWNLCYYSEVLSLSDLWTVSLDHCVSFEERAKRWHAFFLLALLAAYLPGDLDSMILRQRLGKLNASRY